MQRGRGTTRDWLARVSLPLLLLALALGWISPSSAGAAAVSQRLDVALHQSWESTDSPGVQAVVLRNGKLAWQGTAGEAVIGRQAATNRSLFEFGSFSKMMAAAFALHRVEVGRLALDVPIRAYVGRSIPGSGRVTLRMLLSHTAGYPDVYERPPVSELLGAKYDPNRRWTFSKVFESLGKPRHPGRRWEYSNSGYIVLAYLLRRTTDRPLSNAIMRFLKPAGRVQPISESSLTMRRTPEAARLFAHGYLFGVRRLHGCQDDSDRPLWVAVGRRPVFRNRSRRRAIPRRAPGPKPAPLHSDGESDDHADPSISRDRLVRGGRQPLRVRHLPPKRCGMAVAGSRRLLSRILGYGVHQPPEWRHDLRRHERVDEPGVARDQHLAGARKSLRGVNQKPRIRAASHAGRAGCNIRSRSGAPPGRRGRPRQRRSHPSAGG